MEDAVSVIRCKDCKNSFLVIDQDGRKLILCTEMGRRGLKEDDFCSYGTQRKSV